MSRIMDANCHVVQTGKEKKKVSENNSLIVKYNNNYIKGTDKL